MIILKLPLQSMIGNIRQFISETKEYVRVNIKSTDTFLYIC